MHQANRTFSRIGASSAFAFVLALGAAIPLVGCGSNASPNESTPAAENAAPASESASVKTKHGGIAEMALRLSLEQPGLSADQKVKIEAIRTQLTTASAGVKVAHAALAKQIAGQVRANKIDRAALAPQIDAVSAAHEAMRPAEQKALNDLHAVLDAKQRSGLIDAAKAKMGDFKNHRGEAHEHLEQLADDLELSDAQRSEIKSKVRATFIQNMGEHRGEKGQHEARMKELGDAFASENFDAVALDVGKEARPVTQHMTDGMLTMIEATLPELNATQRTKLADHIEQHAAD
jgi:Spy/CpxP family protein refolding chaperone